MAVVALLARSPSALARAGGIASDSCDGCHGGGTTTPAELTVTADPATPSPGAAVTFTLTIRAPGVAVGGAYVTTAGIGTLQALAGEGLAISAQGLTHTAPKPAINGAVTFRFGWQAPAKPGAVDVHVAALAGNGNGAPTGDAPGLGDFQWVFGCTGATFYADLDRDGFGSKVWGTRLGCADDAPPVGFAAAGGDCDENDETVHPGATEVCNQKDDDCNGQTDENAPPVMMWPDADGDGYYTAQTGTPKMGCAPLAGYAARGGDCDDRDAAVHPGATEICNLRDDDCDGQIDELVRPTCGVGWCARSSPSCNVADCVPGPPAQETCNAFDDDCDGELDNDACPAGMTCAGAACVASGGTGLGGRGGAAGSAAGGAGPGGAPGNERAGSGSGCAVAAVPVGRLQTDAVDAIALGLGLALLVVRRGKRRARPAR